MNFIYFLICIALGFALIKYNKWIRDTTGLRFEFFERNIGPGATLDILKFIGVGAVIFSFWVLFHL